MQLVIPQCLTTSKRLKDLTGERFGRLTVVEFAGRVNNATVWRCVCDCGTVHKVRKGNLLHGNTRSCGCLQLELVRARNVALYSQPRIDLTGRVFGRLRVLSVAGKRGRSWMWRCQCSCGRQHDVAGGHLTHGSITSCGCYRVEMARKKLTKHGHGGGRYPGGPGQSPEFRCYQAAKNRCTNPNAEGYDRYGGRGIQFKFASIDEFMACLGPRPSLRHSIDRIDVNGHYEPGNVRWATAKVQGNNTRRNHYVDYCGERLTLSQLAERVGLPHTILRHRLKKGWCLECATTHRPVYKRGKGRTCPHR